MLVVLTQLDWLLTLIALTVVPALFLLIALFNRKITTLATEVRERESLVYSLVQWAMTSIKVVQAFTKEEEEHRRFMGASRASLVATLRLYGWQTLWWSMSVPTPCSAGGSASGSSSYSSRTSPSSTSRSTRSPRAGA
jgi:ATP-binding cassette subfamily B protein/subfamily B ATP-binding cassette protein MsbA